MVDIIQAATTLVAIGITWFATRMYYNHQKLEYIHYRWKSVSDVLCAGHSLANCLADMGYDEDAEQSRRQWDQISKKVGDAFGIDCTGCIYVPDEDDNEEEFGTE